MLKAGIFLDMENLSRCGGWGVRYNAVKNLVEAQGATVLRANAYMAIDVEREERDYEYRQKKESYRSAIRRAGFHLVYKEVKRYYDSEGQLVLKANADLDLAVDALLQSQNLDYVLLGSGDGDFMRLVRALQNLGKRVDLLSFSNTSTDLKHEVDYYFSGYLVPGLLPMNDEQPNRVRGVMHAVNQEKGYGFLTVRTGYATNEVRDDVFCHIRDFQREYNGDYYSTVSNEYFGNLKQRDTILEFDLIEQEDGRVKAANATEFVPESMDS